MMRFYVYRSIIPLFLHIYTSLSLSLSLSLSQSQSLFLLHARVRARARALLLTRARALSLSLFLLHALSLSLLHFSQKKNTCTGEVTGRCFDAAEGAARTMLTSRTSGPAAGVITSSPT